MWGEAWESACAAARPSGSPFHYHALAALLALFPSLFALTDPKFCEKQLSSRRWHSPSAGHPFGFDKRGTDIYARVVYGARASGMIFVGILATIAVVLANHGGTVGALAGILRRLRFDASSRVTDVFFAITAPRRDRVHADVREPRFPSLMVVIVCPCSAGPPIARITRGSVFLAPPRTKVRNRDPARPALPARILRETLIPNSMAPIIVCATVALGTFIVSGLTLSAMGIGLPADVRIVS